VSAAPLPLKTGGLPLDLPFIPDAAYMAFLAGLKNRVHSLHVPLHLAGVADARPPAPAQDQPRIIGLLAPLAKAGVQCFGLLNSRFHAPTLYGDSAFLHALGERLQALADAGVLHGIIYVDHYLLLALAEAFPDLCARLQAVPSVNCQLDSLDKVLRHLGYIARTPFALPGKVVLDRGLNRRLRQLEVLRDQLRLHVPELKVALLANEGCLDHCPFRQAHAGHMALAHLPGHGYGPGHMTANRNLGCTRLFAQRPELLIAAPFIRPEDQRHYAGLADVIKLCGRSRGAQTMRCIIAAYVQGRYEGNLLWLNDSQEPLAHLLFLANDKLPDNFLELVGDCQADCEDCGVCRIMARRCIGEQPPGIAPAPRILQEAACTD
jgi:collagenase-like PrtC family protease